jgi:exopolysaccharide biosynthesis WecB/TagA/CpsF family protein
VFNFLNLEVLDTCRTYGIKEPRFRSDTFTNDIQSLFDQSIFPIMESKAEVIWIGIGAPKQIVLANRLCETLPIIALSVGAAFEIVSGTKLQAPKVFQRFGMEWLFRWIQEPRRLLGRYTIGNVRFLKILADDIFKRAKLKWKNL